MNGDFNFDNLFEDSKFVNKTVVEKVSDSAKEISLEVAREIAGDEVELGDMILIPQGEQT